MECVAMSSLFLVAVIILSLVLILVAIGVRVYNRLVTLRNRYQNAFAQIDVQLKRRYDLIPNLVESVKGYMGHEEETLTRVMAARNGAHGALERAASAPGEAGGMQALASAESALQGAMVHFRATVEGYPDLKADSLVTSLMEELTSTENRVGFARQAFNDAVTLYNTSRETFPAVAFAGSLGFQPAVLLEYQVEREAPAPQVSFR
jgi:LemA protein